METQLKDVIDNINNKKKYYITMFDKDKNKYLYQLYRSTVILNSYGSGEKFFAYLKNKGLIHLELVLQTRNCKNKIKNTQSITLNLEVELKKSSNYIVIEKPMEPVPLKIENVIPEQKPPVFLNNTDINLPQSMSIAILQHDVKQLINENEALKAEIKRLELRNEEILIDSYKRKFEADKNHSNNSLGTTIITTLILNLPSIIDCFKLISQNGLNARTNLNFGSEVKNRFSKFILTIDDKALLFIMSVLNTIKTNQNFESELYQLTKKYNVYG